MFHSSSTDLHVLLKVYRRSGCVASASLWQCQKRLVLHRHVKDREAGSDTSLEYSPCQLFAGWDFPNQRYSIGLSVSVDSSSISLYTSPFNPCQLHLWHSVPLHACGSWWSCLILLAWRLAAASFKGNSIVRTSSTILDWSQRTEPQVYSGITEHSLALQEKLIVMIT